MKKSILKRIKELGGNIDNLQGEILEEIIPSITFDTVLYKRPVDTPWSSAEEQEPIKGIEKFITKYLELYKSDKEAFYKKLFKKYYKITKTGYGQTFWKGELFTPNREGTADYEEWDGYFSHGVDINKIIKLTKDPKSNYIRLFYDYGFPDNIYISLSDPNPENPTLFGTDHEEFFCEVQSLGKLGTYLKNFLTKAELREIIEKKLNK